jgi:hypothetical protein
MFHVCQRGRHDCGVAVAAMVTGVTYEEVLDDWFGRCYPECGLPEQRLKQILEGITESPWQLSYRPRPRPRIDVFRLPEWPVILLVETDRASWHYVAAKGQLVHDPWLPEPYVQRHLPNRGSVHALLEPRRPELLHKHQATRRGRILRELGGELFSAVGQACP